MHLKRLATLTLLVKTALTVKQVSLTKLGRQLSAPIQERSAIRRVDRFLGNQELQGEVGAIRQVIAHRLVGKQQARILVDWSSIPNTTHHVLRAALMASGRALTLYEEIHPEKKLGNAGVQKRFLKRLKGLLPKDCQALIVTDAGFHNEWFETVLKLGWDYLGRVRGGKTYRKVKETVWRSCKKILMGGTFEPEYLGNVDLCRSHPLRTHLYRMKKKPKGRKAQTKKKKIKQSKTSLGHARSGREAWVIATSLAHQKFTSAGRVMKIYDQRMQIEEGFRDLKSAQYGFGFSEARSQGIKRIEILLLIVLLASFIAWLTGWIAEQNKWHYQFQANSIKSHRVLSLFFLGCRVIKRGITIPINEIENLLSKLKNDELFAI